MVQYLCDKFEDYPLGTVHIVFAVNLLETQVIIHSSIVESQNYNCGKFKDFIFTNIIITMLSI